jgi:hypothetical protein
VGMFGSRGGLREVVPVKELCVAPQAAMNSVNPAVNGTQPFIDLRPTSRRKAAKSTKRRSLTDSGELRPKRPK